MAACGTPDSRLLWAAFEQREHLADVRAADRHRDIALRGQQQDAAIALAAKVEHMLDIDDDSFDATARTVARVSCLASAEIDLSQKYSAISPLSDLSEIQE